MIDKSLISQREFARRDGCGEKRVRTGIASGDLPRLPGKRLPAALVGTGWRAGNHPTPARATDRPAASVPAGTLAEARRVREIVLARLRRAEFEARSADLIPRADVVVCWAAIRENVRAHMEPIAAAAAPLVVGKGMAEVRGVLHDLVYEALTAAAAMEFVSTLGATEPEPAVSDTSTKLDAETFKTRDQARLHQLDLDVVRGALVDAGDMETAFLGPMMDLRSHFLSLESALPPRLAGTNEPAARRIIAKAIAAGIAHLPAAPPHLPNRSATRPAPDTEGAPGER